MPAVGHDLGFADLLAGDALGAGRDLHLRQHRALVRLDVRPVGDAGGVAGRLDARDVALDLVHVDDGAGRAVFAGDFGGEGMVWRSSSLRAWTSQYVMPVQSLRATLPVRASDLRPRPVLRCALAIAARRLVECLAILGVEVGIVEQLLLLRDLGLQLLDGLRQRFQRVLLVEVQPALRRGRGRARRPAFLLLLGRAAPSPSRGFRSDAALRSACRNSRRHIRSICRCRRARSPRSRRGRGNRGRG